MSVVRIRRKGGVVVQDCEVYIGRRMTMGGWSLVGSKYANPFKIGDPDVPDVSTAVRKYYLWLHGQEATPASTPAYIGSPSDLLQQGRSELTAKILGCWCKENPSDLCHGDVWIYELTGVLTFPLYTVLKGLISGPFHFRIWGSPR